MLLIIMAAIAALAQGVLIFAGPVPHGELIQAASLGAAIFVLGEALFVSRRREKRIEKLARCREELDRVESQLDQVLLERKGLEGRVRELQTAIDAEVSKTNQLLMNQSGSQDAVMLLSLLQEKGRFVDFLMEDITPFEDERVAAVARFVHQGCRAILKEHARVRPLMEVPEGSETTIEQGYNPLRIKVIGKVDNPPLRGTVLHRGWVVEDLRLPRKTSGSNDGAGIIAPAEVEVRQA